MRSTWWLALSVVLISCGPSTTDPEVLPDEEPDGPRPLTVPLGETLFFAGDDYLAFWGADNPDPVTIVSQPDGSSATLAGDGARLTPDEPGTWVLSRSGEAFELFIDDAPVTADTFLNYNYTPVSPLVAVDATTLLVAAPTSNAVQQVFLTDDGPENGNLIPTGAWPTTVAIWPGSDYALVAQTGRDSIGFLDLTTMTITDAIRVGDEPAGIVIDGDTAYVTASGENKLVRIDLATREISGTLEVGNDPRAMALDLTHGRLFVASLVSSNLHPRGMLQEEEIDPASGTDIAIVDLESFEVSAYVPQVGTINRGLWLSPDANTLVVGVSHANNDRPVTNADAQPHTHGLTIVDVDPASAEPLATRFVDLDEQDTSTGPAASPFSMQLLPDGRQLLVSLSAGKAILALDPVTYEEVARVPTSHDPRGLVLVGDQMWTSAWLSNAVEAVDVPLMPGDALAHTLEIGDDPRLPDILAGQQMFNDAAFSKHGDFSCNNCHIDGLTDGMVWDLLVDGNVNTIAFRNVAGTDPFLWGGALPTLFDFSREVLRLVGADASGQQMEDITKYMQSVTAPPNPSALPGGRLSAEAERGRELFNGAVETGAGAGCGTCHSGALFTNGLTVDGKTEGMLTDVPALIGVYDTAPYGRLGQWETLRDMTEYAVDFTGAVLEPADMDALEAFLLQIPGDQLYLNAAQPLSGADHVWNELPIELTFSQVLAPGQADLFEFERNDGVTRRAVAGTWTLSGRVARFAPEEPLSQEQAYIITVNTGLKASLGQVLPAPIDIRFITGGAPDMDVSGEWRATLRLSQLDLQELVGISVGDVTGSLALLQATGGNVTGVVLTEIDEADIDHVRGVTSGSVMVLEPFRVPTDFGDLMVDGGEFDLVDSDADGYADAATGFFTALGFEVVVDLNRDGDPPADRE